MKYWTHLYTHTVTSTKNCLAENSMSESRFWPQDILWTLITWGFTCLYCYYPHCHLRFLSEKLSHCTIYNYTSPPILALHQVANSNMFPNDKFTLTAAIIFGSEYELNISENMAYSLWRNKEYFKCQHLNLWEHTHWEQNRVVSWLHDKTNMYGHTFCEKDCCINNQNENAMFTNIKHTS